MNLLIRFWGWLIGGVELKSHHLPILSSTACHLANVTLITKLLRVVCPLGCCMMYQRIRWYPLLEAHTRRCWNYGGEGVH